MKIITSLFVLSFALPALASATETELTGSCLAAVEQAIDETNDDETGCIGNSFVDIVDEVNGDTYTVSYGRSACEGAVSGTAEAVLKDVRSQTIKGKVVISECKVKSLEIVDESAD